ncbi:adenylate/guanylate cyclase domain-containing protein [Actinoallomurus soli]|uniref:adenylate/guanylate cyclase domain-containing protein n=1 Tax=Actinoallomurus soli TaxID=2952535 RepID=UPI0020934471|nr:adenylate/guanylate cyclase domain-containing protein [Actinoallomurus soli]MCO5969282.1 adenylate/guanylate cyclase domain-containing protein [Actinoallomurus soli]
MSDVPEPKEIEELLLGGELRFTRIDAIERSGVSPEFTQRLWRAFGFPHLADETVAFTEGDLDALVRIKDLLGEGLLDEEMVLRMVRAVGQTMARLAEWQIDIIVGALADPLQPPSPDVVRMIMEHAEGHIAALEPLLVHAWRRQLAAAGTRALTASAAEDAVPGRLRVAVGFADIVGFTATSRNLGELELADLVERFEETASDVVAEHGGRIVKTLGDEVLYTAETPTLGAEIGLCIAEAVRAGGDTDVRVGMAYGLVLSLMGDVFGTTVNLASRLTSIARPGTVLADAALADGLRGAGAYDLIRIGRRPARGLGIVQPYVVRRAR